MTSGIQKGMYEKEVPDFKMDDSRQEAEIMQDFYTLIYGFEAQRTIDSFGEKGEQAVREAIGDMIKAIGREKLAEIKKEELCTLWRKFGFKDAKRIYCEEVY